MRRTRKELAANGVPEKALKELDRLLEGKSIPHEEEIFSIHKDYTHWIAKGKAGQPVELGVPLSIVESQSWADSVISS